MTAVMDPGAGGVATTPSPGAFAPRAGELHAHTALRGLAALAVVGLHAQSRNPALQDGQTLAFFEMSYLFVDLFFMLSGFIMAETYARRLCDGDARMESRRFLIRRASKVLPNYYVWLVIGLAVIAFELRLVGGAVPDACMEEALLKHFLLVQNLIGSCLYFNVPLWSVATEMIAYLLFPALVLSRVSWQSLAAVAICLYTWLFWVEGGVNGTLGLPPVLRTLAGFLLGMAGAYALSCRRIAGSGWLQLFCLAVAVLCLTFRLEALALVALFALVLVTARNTGPLVRLARWRWVHALGRASFSIYLAHFPLLTLLIVAGGWLAASTGWPVLESRFIFLPVALVLSATAGLLAYVVIERWFEERLRAKNLSRIEFHESKAG